MNFSLQNRVWFSTPTTGNGLTIVVGSAIPGYATISNIPDGSSIGYSIEEGTNYETGTGTYHSAAGGTLDRVTVESSSAGGTTRITLAGSATCFLTMTAAMLGNNSMAFEQSDNIAVTGGTMTGMRVIGYSDGSFTQIGTPMMPDLSWWRRDTAGNIPFAFDVNGNVLVNQLQVFGQASFNNLTISGTFTLPASSAVNIGSLTTVTATISGMLTVGSFAPLSSIPFTSGDVIQPGNSMLPDMSWWVRDTVGTIPIALDNTGAFLVDRLQVFTSAVLAGVSFIGNVAFPANVTLGSLTFLNGDLEQQGNPMVPDLARWVRDTAGNIIFGFTTNGTVIAQNMEIHGTLSAPGFSGGGGGPAASPADTLDITNYGGKGDGNDDIFLGTWSAGQSTLTVSRYTGPISWSTTDHTLSLTNLANATSPGIDPNQVGKYVYIQATDGSGIVATVKITGWSNEGLVTVDTNAPAAITTAIVSWPAFTTADVGKMVRIEGAAISLIRQAWNAGLMPWIGTITLVPAGNQITVANTIAPTFATSSNGQPVRVSWGTDNSACYLTMQPDVVTKGVKYIWHPRTDGVAKTVYCAFALAQRQASDNYYITNFVNAQQTYLQTQWLGDGSVVGVLTDISGRLMPKRIIPSRAPPPKPPVRDIIARLHMPRVVANSNINIVECGDSISKYDPTAQSDGWNPVPVWEGLMIRYNPSKSLHFQNIANIGVGWAELVDPSGGLPWRIAGTDLYFMSSSGHNDFYRGHGIKVQAGINLGHTSGNDSGARPPDVLLTTAKVVASWPQQSAAWNFDGRMHTEVLLRTMAKCQHLGFVDLNDFSEQVVFGASNYHRELQAVPEVNNWAFSTTNPLILYADAYSWSVQITLNGTGLWAALGALHIGLSPMPGNVFIIDRDPVASVWRYEARLWGREVTTTVSTSGATITTASGTTQSGTLSWAAFNNQLTFSGGGFTGKQGLCVLMPGLDISGQAERTYISQVINDTTAVMDDFWWGNPPGSGNVSFNASASLTIGGQVFLPVDVDAGVDVVMTWGSGQEYRGKIVGFTNNNTVTLSPAPPALTNQVVQMWLGRISVPRTNGTQSATAGNTTATFMISFNRDELSLRNTLTSTQFRGPVERYGVRYAPRFRMTGPGPVSANFTNIYVDRDVYYLPSGTPADLWSTDQNFSGGGGGFHDPSILGERITRPVYEALDLCAI